MIFSSEFGKDCTYLVNRDNDRNCFVIHQKPFFIYSALVVFQSSDSNLSLLKMVDFLTFRITDYRQPFGVDILKRERVYPWLGRCTWISEASFFRKAKMVSSIWKAIRALHWWHCNFKVIAFPAYKAKFLRFYLMGNRWFLWWWPSGWRKSDQLFFQHKWIWAWTDCKSRIIWNESKEKINKKFSSGSLNLVLIWLLRISLIEVKFFSTCQ